MAPAGMISITASDTPTPEQNLPTDEPMSPSPSENSAGSGKSRALMRRPANKIIC